MTVSREIQIDVGHRIPCHDSLCRNVHGHRYRIVATLEGPVSDDAGTSSEGMVADFGHLKTLMMRLIADPLDHAFAIHAHDEPLRTFLAGQGFRLVVLDCIPTAENLARWCHDRLAPACRAQFGDSAWLRSVAVHETPNCSAVFEVPCPHGTGAPHTGSAASRN